MGKQCILWGWRSDYQPINNMRAHGVLESLLNKATSKPEACIPPCIIQLNTVQALQCFLTKIAEMDSVKCKDSVNSLLNCLNRQILPTSLQQL
jgi:hypothetical protein